MAGRIFNLLFDCVKEFPQYLTVGLEELAFPHNIFKGLFEYRNIIAVHSGRGFFDIGKARETPAQLRQRFARELHWFTDMIDAIRDL